MAVNDTLALPLTGKTTGVDHRITLYTMLATVPKHDAASTALVHALPGLIIKETHDAATALLVRMLSIHLHHLLTYGILIPADVIAVIAKEIHAKPALKRAFVSVVGAALWGLSINDATRDFAKAIGGALEGCLATTSANPLGSSGALEGYIAMAVLLGPLAASLGTCLFFWHVHFI